LGPDSQARDRLALPAGARRTLVAADSPDSFLDSTPTAVLIRQVVGAVSQFEKAARRQAEDRPRSKEGADREVQRQEERRGAVARDCCAREEARSLSHEQAQALASRHDGRADEARSAPPIGGRSVAASTSGRRAVSMTRASDAAFEALRDASEIRFNSVHNHFNPERHLVTCMLTNRDTLLQHWRSGRRLWRRQPPGKDVSRHAHATAVALQARLAHRPRSR
jgi:hypothetical protein